MTQTRRNFPPLVSATILALLLVLPPPCPAWAKAQTTVRVTSGDHDGYGRLVLDARGLAYSISRDGEHLLIQFTDNPAIGDAPPLPRNVLALRPVLGGLELTFPPGVMVHETRMGSKVVIDVDDPASPGTLPRPGKPGEAPKREPAEKTGEAPAKAPAGPAQDAKSAQAAALGPPGDGAVKPAAPPASDSVVSASGPEMPSEKDAAVSTGSPPSTAKPPENDPAPMPGAVPAAAIPSTQPDVNGPGAPAEPPVTDQTDPPPSWPVTRDPAPTGPSGIIAFKASPPGGLVGAAIQVPFPAQVGAALFSRGPETFVVFDERRPIDLSAVRDDPVFRSAVTTIFPAATLIRMTRPPGQSAILSPAATGWRISIVRASPRPTALTPVRTADGLVLAADATGQVVAITDPQTGGTLMIGTQRTSGQAVAVERRTPEFVLPVTGQGVVVIPASDAISLRITTAGFAIAGRITGLAMSPPMEEVALRAARLTRLFEFPRQTTFDLAWRAKQQSVTAATAPPQARGPPRHALAESLLGLGLGVEAQTLLHIAMKDDPREAATPSTIGLAAIAALLAGRPREAGDLMDPRLTGTDEVAMWRAIQTAMSDEGSPQAAAVLATTAPLLFTYPDGIRRLVLPLALETMVLGGAADAAAPLLAERDHDPRLDYARALLKQARGDNEGALADFDALANARSPLDHARASVHAVELRLTTGLLDAKAAADKLATLQYAWRGDKRDLALRLRIAELRAKTGGWRSVFTILRQAKTDFPGQAEEIDRRLKDAFAAVPRDPSLDTMPATDLIALLEENAELMADGPDGEPMRALLAEKLMALDLPKRADPLLTKLMRAAPYGPSRAGFGATLATLRLREGDGDGAMLALNESNSPDMPDAVRERRALIAARIEAKLGHVAAAVEALAGSQSLEADDTRATILERAQDWPGARDALAALAGRMVPDSGTLTDAQLKVVLRLATAATRMGDDATLASLREKFGARLGKGPQADLFRLLTAEPVRGTADLDRARAEIGLARAVSADMNPKKSAAKTP